MHMMLSALIGCVIHIISFAPITIYYMSPYSCVLNIIIQAMETQK